MFVCFYHDFLNCCLNFLNKVKDFSLSLVPNKSLNFSHIKNGFIIFYYNTVVGIRASPNFLFFSNSFNF